MKHFIGVIALVAAMTLAAWALLGRGFDTLLPLRASEEAFYVDRLFGMHLYVIAFLFALIIGFMIYSFVVFRAKSGDTSDGQYFHGNSTLEVFWTIIPLGIVLYFAVLGARYLIEISAPEANELVVNVIGSQWNWRFDYPEYDISSAELLLPRDRQTRLDITSIDVIHSFWVPEFRVKQDAVPGALNPLRITPTESGNFVVRCAELCGTDHSYMVARVTVMEPAKFEAWIQEKTAPPEGEVTEEDELGLGLELVELNGCLKCHSIDGSASDGPTWLGLYGTEETLVDGTTIVVDDEYLRRSILDPQAEIVAGFDDVDMPLNFAAVFEEEELDWVVDYIESLGSE